MSHESNRPDVMRAMNTLARNQARVVQSIDRLTARVDSLVQATQRRDWGEVAERSRELVAVSREGGYRALSAIAQTLCDEAAKPENEIGVKRSLIRLIGTCGRVCRLDPSPTSETKPADKQPAASPWDPVQAYFAS